MKKTLITRLQLTPVVLSILLTAAHFSRAGNGLLVILSLSLLLLLPFRHPLAARLLQGALLLSGLEWIRTLLALASLRQQLGLPWVRLTVILGVVSLFTIASALIFQSRTMGDRFRFSGQVVE